ncbi:hypothetical protein SUGI_0203660 [Cryptomeria japonica]|nr:hypothetical protein SUGI_0203660 [Cryptomeria japonica]
MASAKVFWTYWFLHFMQFMVLTLAVDMNNMTVEDYVSYINPPSVHKYQHENGDSILCVMHEDQISLLPAGKNKTNWRKMGMNENLKHFKGCPEGTIHVREIKHKHVERSGSVARFIGIKNAWEYMWETEYAMASLLFGEGGIEKATGVMNVWQPPLSPSGTDVLSRGLIRIGVENAEKIVQTIEAGWIVSQILYGDQKSRFFIRWTADGFQKTGCYDQKCPGFVLAKNAPLYPGEAFKEVSIYGNKEKQVELGIAIQYEARNPPAWVVYVGSKEVGYLPANLVPDILPKINTVKWGGEVMVVANFPQSKLDMGSGRFPEGGYPNAAYVRDMDVFKAGGKRMYGGSFQYMQSRPYCYRVGDKDGPSTWGTHIFYGGPGGDETLCRTVQPPPFPGRV